MKRDMEQTQPEHEWTQVEGAPEWRVRLCSHPDMVSFQLDRLDLTFSLVLDWSIATHMDIKLDDENITVPRAAIDAARELLGIPHPQLVEFNGWGDHLSTHKTVIAPNGLRDVKMAKPVLFAPVPAKTYKTKSSAADRVTYCLMGSGFAGDNRHAQTAMRELGITYEMAVPQSMYDQWWFLNCSNIPEELPEYVKLCSIDRFSRLVGNGLSAEDAQRLEESRATNAENAPTGEGQGEERGDD